MDDQKPKIWTKYGLIDESDLVYSHEWTDTEEYISFSETYKKKSDGEVVKHSVHVLAKKPFDLAGIAQGSF